MSLTGGDVAEDGGAVLSREELTVLRSVIRGNASLHFGGGVYAEGGGGQLYVIASTIDDNRAAYFGAGIGAIVYSGGRVRIENSTISNNKPLITTPQAYLRGGGIALHINYNNEADFDIVSSTISGNVASEDGGGIYHGLGKLAIRSSTITNNSAAGMGGGIGSQGNFINHSDKGAPDIAAYPWTLYSIIGDATGAVPGSGVGSFIGTATQPIDPLLGPLADNGGPTATHALLPGSHALNAGDPSSFGESPDDQRGPGFSRIIEGRIDIGAYEAQRRPSADFSAEGIVDGTDFLHWQRGYGSATPTQANGDSDGDGDVDASDLAAWKASFGTMSPPPETETPLPLSVATLVFAELSPEIGADGDASGSVDGGDLTVWESHFGEPAAAEAPALTASESIDSRDSAAVDSIYAAGDFTTLFAEAKSLRPPRRWLLGR